jgi:mannose-1-phosphate guanylyltransferase / mannose-6-phosphate isomerase
MLIPVILSGGAGTRLWPLSRQSYPKPFMAMPDGESLLQKTLRRACAVAAGNPVMTVTSSDHYFVTRDAYRTHPAFASMHYVLEPVGRNTAPALALAALELQQKFGPEATMLVLPSDHLISDHAAFARAVATAYEAARQGYLVTFGITPTRAETGFGYIRQGAAIAGLAANDIAAFVEKPDALTAEHYVRSGAYAWNSGMFCFATRGLLAAFASLTPALMEQARICHLASRRDEQSLRLDTDTFAAMPNISIDYAVMEKASRRAVVPAHFDWNDIGSWKALSELSPPDANGNRRQGDAILVGASNCYVQTTSKRLVAAVGVENLIVVDSDDAVLIVGREHSQDVGKVVAELKARGHEAAKLHLTVRRPWGSYTVLEDAEDAKVKRLIVNPGEVLSLQMHQRRSEHWTVVRGTAKVRVGDREFLLQANESVHIPVKTLHRLENPTSEPIALIEVQCGEYFGEDDIQRFEDRYGRETTIRPA